MCAHSQPHESRPPPGLSWAVNESYVDGKEQLRRKWRKIFHVKNF